MQVKKILNFSEALTDTRLASVAERYGARVFSKVRVADILQIESSGIDGEAYSFALKSHFDFVVSDRSLSPLFAVEFDGPTHEGSTQIKRDTLKNDLCLKFEFPLLRINSRYLEGRYRGLDLLTWIVERWFIEQQIQALQESGELPEDEYFDPAFTLTIEGHSNRFPLWLSVEPLLKIRKVHEAGLCRDPVPSTIEACEPDGTVHIFAYLRVTEDSAVFARGAVRNQQFPVLSSDLLHEIIPFELADALDEYIAGTPATSWPELSEMLDRFQKLYTVLSVSGYGRSNPQPN